MDYKKILKDILIPNKRGIDQKKLNKILNNQNKYYNIFDYLLNKVYYDSASIYETLKRIQLNIDVKPVCPICHKPVNFIGKTSKMFSKYCSNSCRAKDPKNYNNWVEGQKKYNKEHYGVEYNWQRNDIKELRKEKLIEHYGTTKLYTIPEIREKIDKSVREKIDQIRSHRNKTLQEKYNISSIGQLIALPEIQAKINETKRKNKTFNKSQQEDKSYELLKEKYPDIIRQYRSELYPFNCDFYIPSLDLYIECHYSQYHYKHQFDSTNKNDLLYLEELKNRANKSERHKIGKDSQYDKIIYTWTDLDIRKFNIAKENNLNYKVFYNINNLEEWLNNGL